MRFEPSRTLTLVLCVALSTTLFLWGCSPKVSLPPAELQSTENVDPFVARLIALLVTKVKKNPGDARAHGELGLAYEANEIWDPAARSFDNAHRIDPGDPLWPYHAHLCRKNSGETGNSLELLTEHCRNFPRFAPLLFELGNVQLETGDLDGARQSMERCLKFRPESPEALARLAYISLSEGDARSALKFADEALKSNSRYLSARNVRGLALRNLGRADEARADLEAGVGASMGSMPDDGSRRLGEFLVGIGSQINRAADLMDAGRPQDAERLLRGAQQVKPDDVNVLNNLALAIQAQRSGTEALDLLKRARSLQPDYFPTLVNLSDCLVRLQKFEEGLRIADQVVSIDPDKSGGHFTRARTLLGLRRFPEALQALEKVIAIEPNHSNAISAAGEVAMQLGRRDVAEIHFTNAIRLRPDFIPSRVNLAMVLGYRRAFDQAEVHLNYLIERVPEHPRVISLANRLAEMRRTPAPKDGGGR